MVGCGDLPTPPVGHPSEEGIFRSIVFITNEDFYFYAKQVRAGMKNPLLGGVARSDGVGQISASHNQIGYTNHSLPLLK
jgi:hypothetical protein